MKHIGIVISHLRGFEKPKVYLEQYETDGNACSFFLSKSFPDIKGSRIVDLGCGTGNLTFSSYFGGAEFILGIDIDKDALFIALENKKTLISDGYIPLSDRNKIQFLCADVRFLPLRKKFDVCVMNPPFGIKRKGADRVFLKKAFEVADVIWTFLSRDSEPFVRKFSEENGFYVTHSFKTEIHIRMKFRFHRKEIEHLPVDLYRIERQR